MLVKGGSQLPDRRAIMQHAPSVVLHELIPRVRLREQLHHGKHDLHTQRSSRIMDATALEASSFGGSTLGRTLELMSCRR